MRTSKDSCHCDACSLWKARSEWKTHKFSHWEIAPLVHPVSIWAWAVEIFAKGTSYTVDEIMAFRKQPTAIMLVVPITLPSRLQMMQLIPYWSFPRTLTTPNSNTPAILLEGRTGLKITGLALLLDCRVHFYIHFNEAYQAYHYSHQAGFIH